MGLYLWMLLLVDWPLAHRLPTIADSLMHLVSGTPRYEMIIYNQARRNQYLLDCSYARHPEGIDTC